jgi:hypothetical protein
METDKATAMSHRLRVSVQRKRRTAETVDRRLGYDEIPEDSHLLRKPATETVKSLFELKTMVLSICFLLGKTRTGAQSVK